MAFLFSRLSKVSIFPNSAIHTKIAIIEGVLTFQILFQENREPTGIDNAYKVTLLQTSASWIGFNKFYPYHLVSI